MGAGSVVNKDVPDNAIVAGNPAKVLRYNVNGKVYFGELTFTSQGGFMDFYTPEFNLELGSKFDIKDFPVKK